MSGGFDRDDVASFVRRLRRSTAETATDLHALLALGSTEDAERSAITEELLAQIEQSKRACALLERERAKYVDLFHHAPDAYLTTDPRGVVEEANLAAGTLLQVSPEFLPGRPLIGFVARGDTVAFRDFLRGFDTSRHEDGARELLVRVRPRSHQPFVVAVRAYALFSARQRPIVVRWILRPVAPDDGQIGVEAGLAGVVRALLDDMHAPVERVSAWASLLLRDDFVDAQDRQQSRCWGQQAAEQLRRLCSDLEELGATWEARGREPRERVDASELAQRVVESAGFSGAEVRFTRVGRSDDAPLVLLASRASLRRALEILIGRAVAGTAVDDVVTVTLERQGQAAVFAIRSCPGRPPRGWNISAATALRVIESNDGRATLGVGEPWALVSLPLAPA